MNLHLIVSNCLNQKLYLTCHISREFFANKQLGTYLIYVDKTANKCQHFEFSKALAINCINDLNNTFELSTTVTRI